MAEKSPEVGREYRPKSFNQVVFLRLGGKGWRSFIQCALYAPRIAQEMNAVERLDSGKECTRTVGLDSGDTETKKA